MIIVAEQQNAKTEDKAGISSNKPDVPKAEGSKATSNNEVGKKKLTLVIVVPIYWAVVSFFILVSCYIEARPKISKSTKFWEFLIFTFLYFNIAALLCIFLPSNIEKTTDDPPWLFNGLTGSGVAFFLSFLLCILFAKLIKVNYGRGNEACGIFRVVYLSAMMITGFALGSIVIVTGLHASVALSERWLYAFGLIVGVYVILTPIVCVLIFMLGLNTYHEHHSRRGSKKKRAASGYQDDEDDYRDKGRSSPVSGSHRSPPVGRRGHRRPVPVQSARRGSGSSSSQTSPPPPPRSRQPGYLTAPPRQPGYLSAPPRSSKPPQRDSPVLKAPSAQSTGSGYYQQLMAGGNAPQVKSISQYGTLLTGGPASPSPQPGPSLPPPPLPRKTSSQQSTGSGYYQQLMQAGNVPQVKSISQYGALLGGPPK